MDISKWDRIAWIDAGGFTNAPDAPGSARYIRGDIYQTLAEALIEIMMMGKGAEAKIASEALRKAQAL